MGFEREINYGEKKVHLFSSIDLMSQDPMWTLGSCVLSMTIMRQTKMQGKPKRYIHSSMRIGENSTLEEERS